MEIASAREFRSNQGRYLAAAKSGQSVMLISKYGNFKIVPVTEEDETPTTRIVKGLEQVKKIQSGQLPRRTVQDMLNDL